MWYRMVGVSHFTGTPMGCMGCIHTSLVVKASGVSYRVSFPDKRYLVSAHPILTSLATFLDGDRKGVVLGFITDTLYILNNVK